VVCVSGSGLGMFRFTVDGKALFIADSFNGRILEYFIRDSVGNLAFSANCE
jgi:hypothetical protein